MNASGVGPFLRRSSSLANASAVVGLWPVALRQDLRKALVEEDMHKIETWTARHGIAVGDWPASPIDPFFNVNTPADAAEAERIAAQQCDL